MRTKLDRRGITLVELLVALAIVSVLVSAIYTIMMTGMKTYNLSYKQAENQGVIRAAMLSLSTAIRAADTVKVSGTTLIVGSETVKLQGSALVAVNAASGATRTIANGITSFTLSSDGAMITITLQAVQGTATNTLTSLVHVKPY